MDAAATRSEALLHQPCPHTRPGTGRTGGSRWGRAPAKATARARVLDNRGGYMLVDRDTGLPVFGFQCELLPEAVIEYCS